MAVGVTSGLQLFGVVKVSDSISHTRIPRESWLTIPTDTASLIPESIQGGRTAAQLWVSLGVVMTSPWPHARAILSVLSLSLTLFFVVFTSPLFNDPQCQTIVQYMDVQIRRGSQRHQPYVISPFQRMKYFGKNGFICVTELIVLIQTMLLYARYIFSPVITKITWNSDCLERLHLKDIEH